MATRHAGGSDSTSPSNLGDAAETMAQWLEAAATPELWRDLVPELTIGGAAPAPTVRMTADLLADLRAAILTEGYFQLDEVIPTETATALATCVRRLHERAIPGGFAFVFDQPWHLHAWLDEVLASLLGAGYVMLPDFWAWCVTPGSRGWDPHREKGAESLLASGYPKSLSVWVPLTEATPLNGCMYIVPADLDPDYNTAGDGIDVHRLQDVRALPVRPGSVLAWNQTLLHWGGASSARAAEPRISFSIEYQRADVEPFNRPLLAPAATPPPFEARLGLIGKQLLQYDHMLGSHPHLLELGRALLSRFPVAALHHDPPPGMIAP